MITTFWGLSMKKILSWLFIAVLFSSFAFAETALEKCADQFIGGNIQNAHTLFSSPPSLPFGNNLHLCYRDNDASFFAIEYWPDEYAPRWAAYKISPENYGEDGCSTYTRQVANCYFKEATWSGFEGCTSGPDPFHADYRLAGEKLLPSIPRMKTSRASSASTVATRPTTGRTAAAARGRCAREMSPPFPNPLPFCSLVLVCLGLQG